MHIYVKVLKGSECEVTVSSSHTVLEVKQLLQNQVSIPVDQQKLIYQGRSLIDDKCLSHYKIEDGAKLFLMLKRPGGGATPSTASATPTSSKTPAFTPSKAQMTVTPGSSRAQSFTPTSSKPHPFTPSSVKPVVDLQENNVEEYKITEDPTGFWRKLSDFLKRHFTEKDAQKVLIEFKKDYDRGLSSLSLDDIERLASKRLQDKTGYFHQRNV